MRVESSSKFDIERGEWYYVNRTTYDYRVSNPTCTLYETFDRERGEWYPTESYVYRRESDGELHLRDKVDRERVEWSDKETSTKSMAECHVDPDDTISRGQTTYSWSEELNDWQPSRRTIIDDEGYQTDQKYNPQSQTWEVEE